jgi:hypothetical protein
LPLQPPSRYFTVDYAKFVLQLMRAILAIYDYLRRPTRLKSPAFVSCSQDWNSHFKGLQRIEAELLGCIDANAHKSYSRFNCRIRARWIHSCGTSCSHDD